MNVIGDLTRLIKNKFSNTMTKTYIPVNEFQFHELFDDVTSNGLCLGNVYIPEELLVNILSHVPPKYLLDLTLVCKTWCNIIKSEILWMDIYNRHFPHRAKKLPWYVYYSFFTTNNFKYNLLKNGNGQENFKHWKIVKNFGDQFKIEEPPAGADPLPLEVPEFNGYNRCFATSFMECNKVQVITLRNKRLLRYIMAKFMPQIYVSEWVAGRFDCGCSYQLTIRGYSEEYKEKIIVESLCESNELEVKPEFEMSKTIRIQQWQGKKWEKVEILVEEYPPDVTTLLFEHEGRDTQFWKGHYGSKMAGGVVRFVFDSIDPSRVRERNDMDLAGN